MSNLVFSTIKNDLAALQEAVKYFIKTILTPIAYEINIKTYRHIEIEASA